MTTLDIAASPSAHEKTCRTPARPRARVGITTFVHDQSALRVAMALEDLGCDVQRWMVPDFPTRQSLSFSISGERGPSVRAEGPGISRDLMELDVLWFRRLSRACLDPDVLDKADLGTAQRECDLLLEGLYPLLAPGARHINPMRAARLADNKLLQLKKAAGVGLAIPDTLVSNDPARIRSFLRAQSGHGAVHKTMVPKTWIEDGNFVSVYTSRVSEEDLPADDVLRQVPGIFQACVPKDFEVRATFFGDDYLAARVDASGHPMGATDWRAAWQEELDWQPYRLPDAVAARVRLLMRRLGLVFCSIDLIATPSGEFVLLDVNEQGQFLVWEHYTRGELPMLDHFCRFVLEGNGFVARARTFERLRLDRQPESAIEERLAHDLATHTVDSRGGLIRMG